MNHDLNMAEMCWKNVWFLSKKESTLGTSGMNWSKYYIGYRRAGFTATAVLLEIYHFICLAYI